MLRATGAAPENLALEITETELLGDATTSAARFRELRSLGIRIALDDFGTGYSSLSYLHSLPLDTLKIAKPFVDGLTSDGRDAGFIGVIVDLARKLDLDVIAEGIETPAQLACPPRARGRARAGIPGGPSRGGTCRPLPTPDGRRVHSLTRSWRRQIANAAGHSAELSQRPDVTSRMRVSRHGLTIAVVERGDLVMLFLDGELDRMSTPLLTKMLSGLDEQHFDRVWVNLAGLSHIDAGGIDALLEARSRTHRHSREFLVRSPSREVTLAFEERADCAKLM